MISSLTKLRDAAGASPGRLEAVGVAVLAALAVCFARISWRKWPDPLVDFGRELYVPWRLSEGALLFRDVDDFYGPLSQYLHAGLFAVFGPGMMVLVIANLLVFAGICILLYRLIRSAWGPGSALAALAVFIVVFAFSQYTEFGNYNYATPYSYEATHGLLVCLLLAWTLARWTQEGGKAASAAAGLLLGLALVLKAEVILAAGAITVVSLVARRPSRPELLAWLAACLLPSAIFLAWFGSQVPLAQAVEYAGRAWWNVVATSRYTNDPSQLAFLGFDAPLRHAIEQLVATAAALFLFGLVAFIPRLAERARAQGSWMVVAVLAVGACAAVGAVLVHWLETGQALLGLISIYLVFALARRPRAGEAGAYAGVLRVLLATLALALMARMVLNGRIYQFGFVQAALAALVVVAVVLSEVPRLAGPSQRARALCVAMGLGLLVPGLIVLARQSHSLLALKTLPIGEGRDRFLAYDPRVNRSGEFVRAAVDTLAQAGLPKGTRLLVLPDGQMLNYLLRMPSPVPQPNFFSTATAGGRDARVVAALRRDPPELIILVARDLREFGIARYGGEGEQGHRIVAWMQANYSPVAQTGGNPLAGEDGIVLWARNAQAR